MEAVIMNFRQGRHHQKCNHIILRPKGINKKEDTSSLIGKEIVWKSPAGKEIKGKIAASHGNKGAVRAIFEKGLPGQCLGEKIDIN